MINKTLAHYTVLDKLGAGGMGEVYRAEDTKLDRQVAIKVLPEDFAGDEERMARFEREAKTLAALNHPNIAAIHGLEEDAGKSFLVMELVEGETLDQKLAKGALPVEEALEVCRQIAEAVEAAHDKGIIHRDLKPANEKITPEGRVKVLDFGLAKALSEEAEGPVLMDSPTLTAQMTRPGIILGTAPYMSPEQAKGKTVDKRTDIWAFGCILYECLTGKMAFQGDSVSEVLAAIIKGEPDWEKLNMTIPAYPYIQVLIRQCLTKDPRNRLQHIGDARIALHQKPSDLPTTGAAAGSKSSGWSLPLTWILLSLFLIASALFLWTLLSKSETPSAPVKFTITLPPDQDFPEQYHSLATPIALSPDGRTLVYNAVSDYKLHLYRRDLDSMEIVQIPGTEGATSPFFSPDGQWIGFHANGRLQKISISGGNPLTICELTTGVGHGTAWGSPNTVIFSKHLGSGLWRVDANGGEPEQITTPNFEDGEYSHMWPQMLPGDSQVMFDATGKGMSVLSLDTETWTTPIPEVLGADYIPPGYILYQIQSTEWGNLAARPYDLDQLMPVGQEVSVLNGVHSEWRSVKMQLAFSTTGTLAYIPLRSREQQLLLVTRDGIETEIAVLPNFTEGPRFSPEGKKISVDAERDIIVYDLEMGGGGLYLTSFTTSNILDKVNMNCVWAPDGTVIFSSNRAGSWSIYRKSADGTGEAEALLERDRSDFPICWSFDGNDLFLQELNPETAKDIWVLPGADEPKLLIGTEFEEEMASLSPDGKWLAYVSNESGQQEVYVQSYPQMGNLKKISSDGGREPVWRKDGTELELYYRRGESIMSVAVHDSAEFRFSPPVEILKGPYAHGFFTNWDVSPDGESFVFLKRKDNEPARINVIFNWFDELEQKMSQNKLND